MALTGRTRADAASIGRAGLGVSKFGAVAIRHCVTPASILLMRMFVAQYPALL
jgi:hypothetical protein